MNARRRGDIALAAALGAVGALALVPEDSALGYLLVAALCCLLGATLAYYDRGGVGA